nr:hypothetical protein [Exiguobacterium sp. ZOR0005]
MIRFRLTATMAITLCNVMPFRSGVLLRARPCGFFSWLFFASMVKRFRRWSLQSSVYS